MSVAGHGAATGVSSASHRRFESLMRQLRDSTSDRDATERNQQLDDDCGAIDNVRRIVEAAEKKGLLDEDDEESED